MSKPHVLPAQKHKSTADLHSLGQSALVDLWVRKGSHSARHAHGRAASESRHGHPVLVVMLSDVKGGMWLMIVV
jgi:hypothetical protein